MKSENFTYNILIKSIKILVFLWMTFPAISQEPTQLRHCKTPDYKCDFYISFDDQKLKYEDTLYYTWFRAQKLHSTQGNSDGHVLDGPFTKFYHSGQLSEQGDYDMGLKDGKWKSWYENGTLMSVYIFDEGILDGEYQKFDENGNLTESGKFKNGKIHGQWINYTTGDTIQFKNGDEKNAEVSEKKKGFPLWRGRKGEDETDDNNDEKVPFFKRLFGRDKDNEEKGSDQKEKKKKDKKEKDTVEEKKKQIFPLWRHVQRGDEAGGSEGEEKKGRDKKKDKKSDKKKKDA